MRRTNLNRQRALTIRLDELFYDYDEFQSDLDLSLAVQNKDYNTTDIMNKAQFTYFMRLFGDFRTAYIDDKQGRLEATMILVNCYQKYLNSDYLYKMSVEDLNKLNNQEVSDYLGSYANVSPDDESDDANLGIQTKRVMNSKDIRLAFQKAGWNDPYQAMIKDWISQIIEPVQPRTIELYRKGSDWKWI